MEHPRNCSLNIKKFCRIVLGGIAMLTKIVTKAGRLQCLNAVSRIGTHVLSQTGSRPAKAKAIETLSVLYTA